MEVKYCERCGLLIGRVRKNRLYCAECTKIVKREHDRARKRGYKGKNAAVLNLDQEKKKNIMSVAEVQALADKLHLSYAIVSWKLSTGQINPENVR